MSAYSGRDRNCKTFLVILRLLGPKNTPSSSSSSSQYAIQVLVLINATATNQDWYFHQYFLSCWGMPIGEMWDLEKLAETCKEREQYAFYFSSMPANVPGGVGSHPNAMAIF